ncbi:Outer membrane protein beta-barrel domain-containing protein [Chitinophaga sp. CF118]|uniref:outer membrane beta-barrel protein n=1 Tax=Chitinophaga sp. CF118 TaxID=1884367 RepID=UPI0008E9E5C7|nr:outer membrane beta-barrel protein [Chitinophaga sp. CF118]SFD32179.1 Outer membrane protein beta-barrel domain-containing protein [Chitinophaga sp. CF118]
MKKIFFTLGMLLASYSIFAQDAKNVVANKAMGATQHSKDFLVIQLGYVGLNGTGASDINSGFNREFNLAFMYDIPLKNTNFSLAAGLGVSSSNIYLKDQMIDLTKVSSSPDFESTTSYKKFKLAMNYLEIPLEIRYRQVPENANKGFKVGLGIKIGNLVNVHTRSVATVNGSKHIEKEANKSLFNTWRFAGTARVGYGNFSLYGTYALTTMFKESGTYDIKPYTIGISFSGL